MNPPFADELVSTTRVAKALGVSVSTVKRWVEDGLLPAQKTAGGHRKLLWADVLEVARRERLPTADVAKAMSGGRRQKPKCQPSKLEHAFYEAMLGGQAENVRSILIGAYQAGTSIETLADEVIAPAMRHIGHDWETQRIDVMHEHRGTQLCASALFELKALLENRADRKRLLAMGAAPAGDWSILPTLLAQMVLGDAGWEAVNLGPNTPLLSLALAVKEMRPKLVWVSVSHLIDPNQFASDYRLLYATADEVGAAVAIGGRALDPAIRETLPYSAYGDGLSHLAAFAKTINPPPRRPKRGRPRAV